MANKFGCLMLQVPAVQIPHYAELLAAFEAKDLYESDEPGDFGIEYDPHVTVLYGYHDDGSAAYPGKVMKAAKSLLTGPSIPLTLTGISTFDNEKFDVVKFDVRSAGLTKLNKALAEKFEHTNDYDYHPHLTLAYVKPGKGKEYAEKLWKMVAAAKDQVLLRGTKLMYSRPTGEKLIHPTLS